MCMNIQTKIVQIRNLYCLMCEDKVSEALKNIKGIVEHRTNVYTKELFLKYDTSLISFANILKYLNENNFMADETYKFLSYEFFLILLIILYKILHIVFYSLDFSVLFIIPTILFFKNSRDLIYSKKWSNNSITRLSSILCYFLGLYLFFFDDYTIRSAEYVILSVDILFYSLVNSFTLAYIVNISKINLYSINQIKNRYNKMDKKLKVGDVIVQSEGYVYVDGTVVEGECIVDESDITGEEALKHKVLNDQILSSTQIIEGNVKLRIDQIGKQTYTGKVLSLIEESGFKDAYTYNESKSLYTICLSLLSATIYYLWSKEDQILLSSFKIFISTLISLCPCVFLISEPLISLKGRKYLLAHDIVMNEFNNVFSQHPNIIFIDKTGTLTESYLKVISYKIFENEEKYGQIIKRMEKKYRNTVYGSIYRLFKTENTVIDQETVEFVCGGGIRCQYEGKEFRLGSRSFVTKSINHGTKEKVVYFSVEYDIKGYFILSDNLAHNARMIISNLQRYYSNIVILSGDIKSNVKRIAKKLNIRKYYYEMTSKDKLNVIANNSAIMVGDGTNDIPSFKASKISISVNQNNTSSDFIILTEGITKLPFLLKYIKKMSRKNRINYMFAVTYNITILIISSKAELPCYSMYFSLLFIICNSLL